MKRPRLAALVVASSFLLATTGMSGCGGDDPPPPPHGPFFGIAPEGEINETDYARMAAGGVGTVRVAFAWNGVETETASPYYWGGYDPIFMRIAENEMVPLVTAFGTPAKYAKDPRTAPTEDPEALDAWVDFLKAAAERYGPEGSFWEALERSHPEIDPSPVRTWEIWNEPNSSTFWQPEPDVGDYRELLLRSAEAIRSVDPSATILSAGMFATPQSDGAITSYDFLEDLFEKKSVKETVDVVGIHPYGPDAEAVFGQVERTRGVLDEAGVDADMWATEVGWGSVPNMKSDLAKTPEEQAELLDETLGRLFEERDSWGIDGVIWYTWHDPPQSIGACGWCRSAGLLESDRDAKPAWGRFTALAGGEE